MRPARHCRPCPGAAACILLVAASALISVGCGDGGGSAGPGARAVLLTIHADSVVNRVDERIYGLFLEHICHSVDGGLWGDMLWNRGFEEVAGEGLWLVEGPLLTQIAETERAAYRMGESGWAVRRLQMDLRLLTGEAIGILLTGHGGSSVLACRLEEESIGFTLVVGGDTVTTVRNIPFWLRQYEWRDIQVAVEGDTATFALDGRDHRLPLPSGLPAPDGVTLVTEGATAQFTNVDLLGEGDEELLEELPLPPDPGDGLVPLHWSREGRGRVQPIPMDPFSGRLCIRLLSPGEGVQLSQGGLRLSAGEDYAGRVRMRGRTVGGSLSVCLRDGGEVLAREVLADPAGEWQEREFLLSSPVDTDSAVLCFELRGTGDVFLDVPSLFPMERLRSGGLRMDLVEAISDLRPSVLRWPGGRFASLYRWKDGIGPIRERSPFLLPRLEGTMDANSFGTDEFMGLCRELGTEPVLVVNVGEYDLPGRREEYLQDALDWLEYCNGPPDSEWGAVRAGGGHVEPYGVRYWELGNETWNMGTGEYADVVRDFGRAMLDADGSIEIIACGDGEMWQEGLLPEISGLADYISLHHYEEPSNYAEGALEREIYLREIEEAVEVSPASDIGVFHSEWNLTEGVDWRGGLYAAGLLNVLEKRGELVRMASPALLLRHTESGLWDNALVNFDREGWFPSGAYVTMRLWRESFVPLRLHMEGPAIARGWVATASEEGDRIYLKMMNPSGDTVHVSASVQGASTEPGDGALTVIAPGGLDAACSMEEPEAIRPVSSGVVHEGWTYELTLPGYSAAVLELRPAAEGA